jgi:deazaflavin-dependent oxidoreductase (nitroreductase family)
MLKPDLALRRLTLVALVLALAAALLQLARMPEPWPDWYRRLVRLTHPILYRLGLVGGQRSSLASIEYVGRKSGRLRQTPVWAFVTDDHVLVGLPYGRGVDWVRNVLASGHCRMRIHGQVYELDEPQVRASAELPELPGWRKRMFSESMEYLRLRVFSVHPGTLDSVRPEDWYLQNKPRLMRLVRFYFRPFRKHLAEAYGKAAGEAIVRDATRRFEDQLPDVPYIGGGQNSFTITLVKVAAKLAMYRTLRARGASTEEAARLIHLGEVSFYRSVPTRWLMRLQGRLFLTRKGMDQWRRIAATSQQRRYADDWVFEVVEGDGREFELGLDCIECGAIKYLEREGAPELAQYLCWIDYPQFAAMGLRLVRTETIAQGGQRCDFRLSRGEPTQVEPEFLRV